MPAAVNSDLLDKIKDLSDRAVHGTGVEIAEVQLRGAGPGRLLRIYIDKPGGVTHGDCELVSERVSRLLDEAETMPEESYTLEVSSLGPDRKFTSPRDYERVVGQKIAITLRTPSDGKPRLEGRLQSVSPGSLQLESGGQTVEVALENVAKAKLKFEP